MENNKQKVLGIAIVIIAFIGLIVFGISNYLKVSDLEQKLEENSTESSYLDQSKIIDELHKEIERLKNQEKEETSSNDNIVIRESFDLDSVKKAAQSFIEIYYNHDNASMYDMYDKIKPLVNEYVYQELAGHVEPDESQHENVDGIYYRSRLDQTKMYCNKINDNKADIFIMTDLRIQTNKNKPATVSQILLNFEMENVNDKWVVSNIKLKSAIQINHIPV